MDNFKLNYAIIPLIAIITSLIGKYLVGVNSAWYTKLNRPWFTPADWLFSIIWQIIFVTNTIAALVIWNQFTSGWVLFFSMILFALAALLNIAWAYVFFQQHQLARSVVITLVTDCVAWGLFVMNWHYSSLVALLILPYPVWMLFATTLNIAFWLRNRTTIKPTELP